MVATRKWSRIAERVGARTVRIIALTSWLVSWVVSEAPASPGQMDASFAGLQAISTGLNVMCHAVGPDGKIALAGNSGIALLIARRHSNGDPDFSFGGDGNVVVTNLQYPMVARSVAVQADGKIVVAGYTNTAPRDFLVARVTASGLPDPTFNGDGFATLGFSNDTDEAEKVLIQPDGKIVVVGRSYVNDDNDWDFAVARFLPNGTLDATFNDDGKATLNFGGDESCYDAVLQADGKLIMVGGSIDGVLADEDFAIARLHVNGYVDNSFDGDGKVTTGFGDSERAYAVAIQPNDLRIVATGRGKVARYYSSDGSLDGSLDGDGKLSISLNAYDVAVTPGGKITLIGFEASSVRLRRLNSNGSPDPEFGNPIVESGENLDLPSLSLLPDGRLLAVTPRGPDCAIRRYWHEGDLDGGGRQIVAWNDATFPPGSMEVAEDVRIQADGKIVLAGHVSTVGFGETDFAVARLLPDGRLDPSFGVQGRSTLSLGNSDFGKAVAIQPDGKIVVAGYTGNGNATNFMIARFNASGTLDNTFGFGGFNALDFAGGPDFGWALALQPDGKILVAGTVFNGARNVFGVARFQADGTVDNTFDSDGRRLYEFSVGPSHWASAIVVQGTSRILVGGHVGADFAVVAFTMTGAVDNTFAMGTGHVTSSLGGDDYLEAMVIGGDGRIYGAGTRVTGGNADWALARWQANAGLWPCLPVCPWTSTFVDFGATSGWVDAMDVRGDGHLVVAGTAGNFARWAHFTPGSTTPSATGMTHFPGDQTAGLAVRFAGANQVVLAGSHTFQNDRNMTVARFETIGNTTVAVDDGPPGAPSIVRLAAPVPNPLVKRSMFAFELPRAGAVTLAIHDISGRRVRSLVHGPLGAGRHQQFWDGTDDQGRAVVAGMYFARLEAEAGHARTSVVVLR